MTIIMVSISKPSDSLMSVFGNRMIFQRFLPIHPFLLQNNWYALLFTDQHCVPSTAAVLLFCVYIEDGKVCFNWLLLPKRNPGYLKDVPNQINLLIWSEPVPCCFAALSPVGREVIVA